MRSAATCRRRGDRRRFDEEFASAGALAAAVVVADAAIVAEPTGEEIAVAVAHKGFTGTASSFTAAPPRLTSGGGPRRDRHMGHVLVALDRLSQRLAPAGHPLLGRGSLHASIIEGGRESSSYPGSCTLQLERRTLPGETVETVEAELRALLDEVSTGGTPVDAELHTTIVREPFEVDRDHPIVRAALDALGAETPVIGVPYWAESAIFAAPGISTVIFGPGSQAPTPMWIGWNSAVRPVRRRARRVHRRLFRLTVSRRPGRPCLALSEADLDCSATAGDACESFSHLRTRTGINLVTRRQIERF